MTRHTIEPWIYFLLRISMGVVFFYGGITKVLDPEWTAAGFLQNASTFPRMYEWFGNAANIGWVDFLNQWGLLVIGVALILGIGLRVATVAGMLLMLLYYLPGLDFPKAGSHSFIIDDHIIYILVLALLFAHEYARKWSLQKSFMKLFKRARY